MRRLRRWGFRARATNIGEMSETVGASRLVTSVSGRPMTLTDQGVLYVADVADVPAASPAQRPHVLVTTGAAFRSTLSVPFAPKLTWAMGMVWFHGTGR